MASTACCPRPLLLPPRQSALTCDFGAQQRANGFRGDQQQQRRRLEREMSQSRIPLRFSFYSSPLTTGPCSLSLPLPCRELARPAPLSAAAGRGNAVAAAADASERSQHSEHQSCERDRSQQKTECTAPPPQQQLVNRRSLLHLTAVLAGASSLIGASSTVWAPTAEAAEAASTILGDPTVTLADVTPAIAPQGRLSRSEEATVSLFERTTYSVVNLFDVTLRPSVNTTGQVEVPEGNGSGIVWDAAGHIVTNYHVIGSALSQKRPIGSPVARVALLASDGFQRNFEGVLVGADRSKDLAVIKINAPPELLRPLPVGDSSALRVGQRCFAIGNPFGFDHTLTAGVVSGLNRDIQSAAGVVIGGGVQTDAAINPGNSGGPLLDAKGNLIGVNTAIFTRTGTSAGVGFAIPASTVARAVPQLIAYGKVVRPSLGAQFAADSVARKLGVKSGALLLAVLPESAAARAGLVPTRRGLTGTIVPGDVVQSIDSFQVRSVADVEKALDSLSIGQRVGVGILRDNQTLSVELTLQEDNRQ